MSSMSRDSSSAPVDLEKGSATDEEQVEVNPRRGMCIRASLDVIVAVYTLFLVGVTVWMVKVSDNWWDPWPVVLIFIAILLWTFWMTPKLKDGYIRKYATKRTMARDSDLSTKLLTASKK